MVDLLGRKWSFNFVEISSKDLVPGVSGARRSLRVAYVDDPMELSSIGTFLSSSMVLALKYSVTLSR